jgi:hypothetical protein
VILSQLGILDLLLVSIRQDPDHGDLTCKLQLLHEDLIEQMPNGRADSFRLTERGKVYLSYLTTVPLPVQGWRMPNGRFDALSDLILGPGNEPPFAATQEAFERGVRPPDEGKPPPPPVRVRMAKPTDPTELKSLANRLLDLGMGMNEVKDELELTDAQVREYFYGS